MTAMSGARYRAGFGHFRYRAVYNVHIPRAQEILGVERKVHTAEHLASAVFYLGAAVCEVPRAKVVAGSAGTSAGTAGMSACAPEVVIHPFATTAGKTWGAGGFVEVAQYLRQSGLEPVFIGGGGDDFSPFRAFRVVSGAPLSEIKRLIGGASMFVGNDSGPAHLAAALGVPAVVIFGASDAAIWGPWRTASEVVTAPNGAAQVIEALARLRVAA
jgi:ADP-heptose:LPS heptosyltransferase